MNPVTVDEVLALAVRADAARQGDLAEALCRAADALVDRGWTPSKEMGRPFLPPGARASRFALSTAK